jgi:phosphoribosylanthranilate isomerase
VTKIKICGITTLEDALVAVEAGADLLGFIFYEPSPRYVAPEVVREIMSVIRDRGRETEDREQYPRSPGLRSPVFRPIFVGVFVNTPMEIVAQTLDFCQLDAAQLHGEEPPEFVNHFEGRAFKAIRPQSQEEAERLTQKYLPCSPAPLLPCFLLDAYHPHLYGGTGHVTDWTLAANIARCYPIMLAGSLTPANVVEAIRAVQPWGVDVSSGVEAEKGKKNHDKVRRFVEAVRLIDQVLPRTEVQG